MKPDIAILTESSHKNWGTQFAIEHYLDPLRDHHEVEHLYLFDIGPKNGKAATKTELKQFDPQVLEGFRYVLLVGNTPLTLITGEAGISKRRGKPFEQNGVIYLPVNNPSIIKHDPTQEQTVQSDLRLFRDIIKFGGIPKEKSLNIRVVMENSDVAEMLDDLRGRVSCDIETNSLNPFQTHITKGDQRIPEPAKIVTVGFGTRTTQWILPVSHSQSPWQLDRVIEILESALEVIEKREVMLVFQNGKFDVLWMWVILGIRFTNHFDTMLAHFLLDENSRHGLKGLAQKFLGAPDWEVSLSVKKGESSLMSMVPYHAHDLFYTRKLSFQLESMLKLEPEVKAVFDHILMPCANLFVEIEYDGVYIDVDKFGEAEAFLRGQYNQALKELAQWEPGQRRDAKGRYEDFNWGSTQQLSWLLYEHLKLPVIERTPTGNPSCSESVIKRLNHPCTTALLKFREAKQQLSFFIDGWKPYLHKRPDGYYLHPSFKLHGTVTGRLSCENPNLQQVPRDPRIRTLISAPDGWTLIECDLSQIELRVAAELAGEENMIHAFVNGIDVHWLTAIREIERGGALKDLVIDTAQTWKQTKGLTYSEAIKILIEMGPDEAVSINKEWKEHRKKAKAINFGYLYGMWWKKFKDYARDNYGVIISDQDAEASREFFFDAYPAFNSWHKRQKSFAKRHGYVQSLSGRKRRLPDAKSRPDTPEGKAALRQAINSPVQSFANEINLMAALQLRKEFGRNVVRICGTVHDAVLFRVKNSRVKEVYNRMLEIMKRPELMDVFDIDLSVPIEADGSIGPWGAGVSLREWEEANG